MKTIEKLKRLKISGFEAKRKIRSMSKEERIEVLLDKELIDKLDMGLFSLIDLIVEIDSDETKLQLLKIYDFKGFEKRVVFKSLSDENKKTIILENEENLRNWDMADLISSLTLDGVIEFINSNKDFLENKRIKPYEITRKMTIEKQLQLAGKIEELNLPEAEKRKVVATFSNETKKDIDLEKIDEKYRPLIGIKVSSDFLSEGKIILELDTDFGKYKDLNELLRINPITRVKTDEDRKKLLELCKIYPDIKIEDNIVIGFSTGEEYIKGEEWIDCVLKGIQAEWTDVQKLAYIDTAIGKKISYSPEFETEAEESEDARALWKIITRGYGVCNGIAQIEQYLLGRVGIQSQMVSGYHHSFVIVKNIEIPTAEGIIQGDTLIDPTWNLTASRYGALPQHFCKSYEELRKVDIDSSRKRPRMSQK